MGWIYIFIRTYPFWAVPLAIVILLSWVNKRTRPKGMSALFWIIVSTSLIASSIFFLMEHGQFTAVPLVHELIIKSHNDSQ